MIESGIIIAMSLLIANLLIGIITLRRVITMDVTNISICLGKRPENVQAPAKKETKKVAVKKTVAKKPTTKEKK